VRIELSADGTSAKIAVAWHPEFRAADGIQTHRVDIGVFANNGATWSVPAILSFYMLPNEVRFYDAKGDMEEICYDAGNPDPGLPANTDLRWLDLGARLKSGQEDAGVVLLNHAMAKVAIAGLQALTEKLSSEHQAWRKLSSDAAKRKQADQALAALQSKLRAGLQATFDSRGKSLAQAFEDGVKTVAGTDDLYLAEQNVIHGLVKNSAKPDAMQSFTTARQRLADFRILKQDGPDRFSPLVNLAALTAGEKHHLTQFHLTLLSLALLPEFLDRVEASAYVDPHLTTPKAWRDLYHYGADGKPAGWSRIMDGRVYEFDAEGRLAATDQTQPAVRVKYVRDDKTGKLLFVPE
jgi:hypothetical protein